MYDTVSGKRKDPSGTFQDRQVPQTKDDSCVRSVCFTPDSKCLFTGSEDKTVKVWDVATESIVRAYGAPDAQSAAGDGHSLDIYSLDCSASEKFIASGSGDKTVKLWSVENGACLHSLGNNNTGPTDGVTSVSINQQETLVASGSLDRVVRVWDVQTSPVTSWRRPTT